MHWWGDGEIQLLCLRPPWRWSENRPSGFWKFILSANSQESRWDQLWCFQVQKGVLNVGLGGGRWLGLWTHWIMDLWSHLPGQCTTPHKLRTKIQWGNLSSKNNNITVLILIFVYGSFIKNFKSISSLNPYTIPMRFWHYTHFTEEETEVLRN